MYCLTSASVARASREAFARLAGSAAGSARAGDALLRMLDAANITLESINLSRPTLDDVFLTLTGRSLRDDSHSSAANGRPPREPAAAGKE